MPYCPTVYENPTLNWLSKHAIEVLIAGVFALLIWEANLLLDVKDRQTVLKTEMTHVKSDVSSMKTNVQSMESEVRSISRAVNDVESHKDTLREMVVEIREDVHNLKK